MVTNLGTGLSFRVNDETGDSDTTPFAIDASGNVGIGTTGPGAKLQVNGVTYLGGASPTLSGSQGQLYVVGDWNGSSDAQFQITGQTNLNKRLRLGYDTTSDLGYIQATEIGVGNKNLALNAAGGNVGIGTTGPVNKLDVVGNLGIKSGNALRLYNSGDSSYTTVTFDGSYWSGNWPFKVEAGSVNPILTINQTSTGDIAQFQDNGTSVLTIKDGGNVGIGTTVPESKLHVFAGSAGAVTSSTTTGITIEDDNDAQLQFLTPNVNAGNIFFGDVDDADRAIFG